MALGSCVDLTGMQCCSLDLLFHGVDVLGVDDRGGLQPTKQPTPLPRGRAPTTTASWKPTNGIAALLGFGLSIGCSDYSVVAVEHLMCSGSGLETNQPPLKCQPGFYLQWRLARIAHHQQLSRSYWLYASCAGLSMFVTPNIAV
jgi:hypothetical protein